MTLHKQNPTETQTWKKLRDHFYEMQFVKIQHLFAQNPDRARDFHIQWNDFLFDFSKNRISETTLSLLLSLAEELNLKQGIDALVQDRKSTRLNSSHVKISY